MMKSEKKGHKTFEEAKKSNHSVRARLIKYVKEHPSNKNMAMKYFDSSRLYTGSSVAECALNYCEYLNKHDKCHSPFDRHAWGLEAWLDAMDDDKHRFEEFGMNELDIDKFDASKMTDQHVEDYINSSYMEDNDFEIFEESDIISYDW
jgi:hypothetical protein